VPSHNELSWRSSARDDEPTELPKPHFICVAVYCDSVSLRIAIFIVGVVASEYRRFQLEPSSETPNTFEVK
jgi:hypothetical protein